MKKLLVFPALLLCLLLALPLSAFAATDCTDEELNITFTVPDGWTRFSDAETESKKYVFSKDSSEKGTYFSYSVMDMYAALDESAKEKYTRDDLDNSAFTLEEYKAMFEENLSADKGVTNLDITQATVGENDFFKLTFNQAQSDGSTEGVILYTHIYDGYHTYYRYESYEDTLDAAEAEAIISTVSFNNETGKNKTQTDAEKELKDTGKDVLSGIAKPVIVGVVAIIIGLLRFIKVKRHEKKNPPLNPEEAAVNQNNVFVATPAAPAEPEAPAAEPVPVEEPAAEPEEAPPTDEITE